MKRIIRVSMLLFLAAVLFIPILPSSAQGQQTDLNGSKLKAISSSLKASQEPKKVDGKKSVQSYDNPNDYRLVNPGEVAGTLIDSYPTTQKFTFVGVKDYSEDEMNVQLTYNCDYSYAKDPIATLEFYSNVNGHLVYLGFTEFDTSGYTNVNLNSLIDKEEYANDPYIYIRLGVSESEYDDYYSDVIQFKVINPFYNPDSLGGEHYVLISNESTNPEDLESTGNLDSLKINHGNNAMTNINADAYKIDYVKKVNKDNLKRGPIRKSIRSSVIPTYNIGDKKSFWVQNLYSNYYYSIDSQLQYIGSKVLVWVNNNQISQSDAAKLGQEFDSRIYSTIRDNFGQESDVNYDGKINILVYDIQDGWDGYFNTSYVAGYFDPNDLYPGTYSNQSEIFYIDTKPLMGTGSTKDVTQSYDTLAHEFQHMVNFNENVLKENNDPMDTWLDEGLSMAAEQIYKGKALDDRIDYYNQSESIAEGHSLLNWDYDGDTLANYSLSYLFVQYLKLQAGQGDKIFKEIIDDPNNDYKAVEDIVKQYIDPNLSFGKFMTDFRAALLLKEKTGLYGFKDDHAFDVLQPRVYDGSIAYLYGGGAIVKSITSTNSFTIPNDKGTNTTYTLLSVPPLDLKVNSISDNDMKVTGTSKGGAIVFAKSGNTQLGYAIAASNGSFSIALKSKLKAGTSVTVYAADESGNTSVAKKITVSDKTPPGKPSVNTIGDNQLTISGKAEPGATVYAKTGNTTLGQATASSKGDFTIKLKSKLKAGTTVTVYAVDKAGNKSTSATAKVVDKTPPAKPTVSTVGDNQLTISGKAEPGATVYIKTGSKTLGKVTASSKGTFSLKLKSKLKAGTVLTVYAVDKAGNKSASATVKVVDKTPPKTPSVNAITSKTTYVTGKGEYGSTVYVYYGSHYLGKAAVQRNGTFKVKIAHQKKGRTLKIYAKDKAGNRSAYKYVKVK